ncbi:MAG: DUF262 domain-containing protein [Caldisphaera sp.]
MTSLFKPRFYSINDFREWDAKGELLLVPRFQRRAVWKDEARSYLIDSIINGYPIPQIYMRIKIDTESGKSVREVVDGQQRLRAILDFLKDKFGIMSVHNKLYGGMLFSRLPEEVQNEFLNYELSTMLILDEKDTTVLEVFNRLNTYTITLNKIEKLNAKYFGAFKQTAFELGINFNRFWLDNKILTEKNILRMDDAGLCAELLIAMMAGIKPGGKKVLEEFFKNYDDEFKERDKFVERFKKVIDIIGDIFSGELVNTKFHEKGLFYSLFCVIYNSTYGLEGIQARERVKITQGDYLKVKEALLELDKTLRNLDEYNAPKEVIFALGGHTNNISSRKIRYDFISKKIAEKLQ